VLSVLEVIVVVFIASEKVIEIEVFLLKIVSLFAGSTDTMLGRIPSITMVLFTLREPVALGEGRVIVALLDALSRMVPLFSESEPVEVYSRSLELSPDCTV